MEKRCASLFCRAARRVNIPNFLDFIFYSTLLSLHNIIDGRETAATIRLSVGSEVAGRARGVRNPVHVLHSDFVVVCQPLRAW